MKSNNVKKRSLKTKLILTNTILLLVPVLIVLIIFFTYISEREESAVSSYFIDNTKTLHRSLGKTIDTVNQMSVYLVGNEIIRSYLAAANSETPDSLSQITDLRKRAYNELNFFPIRTQYLSSIGIFPYNSAGLSNGLTRNLTISTEEKELAQKYNGSFYWYRSGSRLFFCRLIKNIYAPDEILGYQKIELNTGLLESELRSNIHETNAKYALCDESGCVLINCFDNYEPKIIENSRIIPSVLGQAASSDAKEIQTFTCNGYRIMALHNESDKTILVGAMPLQNHFNNPPITLLLLVTAVICIVLSCSLMAVYSNHVVIKPLNKLTTLMKRIEKEDYTVRFHIQKNDEISTVAQQFNFMSQKLEHLYKEIYLEKLNLKEAEYAALESEINPHFLFNTLNTISWMLELKQTVNAEDMICSLAGMYKVSLYKTVDGLIPLAMDIEHMKNYLNIQKLRLGDRFTYSMDIQPSLNPEWLMVPKLILQPLVENSITHGLKAIDSGEVIVSIYQECSILYYKIYDNGIGFEDKIIENALSQNGQDAIHGRCIHNLNERIKLKFGSSYGLSYAHPADGGTMVEVRFPVIFTGQGGNTECSDY